MTTQEGLLSGENISNENNDNDLELDRLFEVYEYIPFSLKEKLRNKGFTLKKLLELKNDDIKSNFDETDLADVSLLCRALDEYALNILRQHNESKNNNESEAEYDVAILQTIIVRKREAEAPGAPNARNPAQALNIQNNIDSDCIKWSDFGISSFIEDDNYEFFLFHYLLTYTVYYIILNSFWPWGSIAGVIILYLVITIVYIMYKYKTNFAVSFVKSLYLIIFYPIFLYIKVPLYDSILYPVKYYINLCDTKPVTHKDYTEHNKTYIDIMETIINNKETRFLKIYLTMMTLTMIPFIGCLIAIYWNNSNQYNDEIYYNTWEYGNYGTYYYYDESRRTLYVVFGYIAIGFASITAILILVGLIVIIKLRFVKALIFWYIFVIILFGVGFPVFIFGGIVALFVKCIQKCT